ncbi:voltage-dependent calcium channel subunit alpha-2/delta-3 [Salvelinus namaycush]|uniref:Voltage-dependent calcium channel subunit alpha-2/delta-3 n=1 Tax=Salvelinus namaycush TaxID=8040 RepID=A0A8U1H289_SALNM|nr:voltage-dependent calcium channel subunit alpha-2/delta-3 [Salvelinus namaycush]
MVTPPNKPTPQTRARYSATEHVKALDIRYARLRAALFPYRLRAALFPYRLRAALFPYRQRAAQFPYRQRAALFPYWLRAALFPYRLRAALFPYRLRAALFPYRLRAALFPYRLRAALFLYRQRAALFPYRLMAALFPYRLMAALFPYRLMAALFPYRLRAALFPYRQRAALFTYRLRAALFPYRQRAALFPFRQRAALFPYWLRAALFPYWLRAALFPFRLRAALFPYRQRAALFTYRLRAALFTYRLRAALFPYWLRAALVKLWASAFGGEIKSISAKYSGSQLLQKTVQTKYKEFERAVRVEEIDGLRLVKKLAENMEEMFHKKSEAMKRLVEAAEEAHLQHEDDPDLQLYLSLPLSLSLSIYLPLSSFLSDSAIVNGVYWSEALNKVFVDNFERDPSLIWQYFGSAKGFFRQYPGIKWRPDEHGVIAFDCRNRKWYIQAATSPKDVVILVDVSGSMKGLRLTIARQTVSSILDTLGDDDFFNVIAYNDEVHYVEPCLNGTLVQADVTNKDHFRMNLDKLLAKGIGMLDVGLTEAFEVLNDFNQTGRGSVCSQAIMLVTDGAVDTYDSVFAKYNWPDRKVRIFPYLIGRESAFADNLKWMACANKGYFTQISTLADVQENVMEYLHVLSRPKVIAQEHDTVWTEAYIDSTVSGHRSPISHMG